jgi:hypothetical protein
MARRQSTYIRLCKEEFEALTHEERRDYLSRAFIERHAQMDRNERLIERQKEFLKGKPLQPLKRRFNVGTAVDEVSVDSDLARSGD